MKLSAHLVNYIKLNWGVDALENKIRIQNDHNKLEKWSDVNRMEFHVDKCKVWCLGQNNQMCCSKLRNGWLLTTKRDLDYKLNMKQQCVIVSRKAIRYWNVLTGELHGSCRKWFFYSLQLQDSCGAL